MKIGICCETDHERGLVAASFSQSPFLLIVDAEENAIVQVYAKQDPENRFFAEKILEHDCEAVICGPLNTAEFDLLANAGVSRFLGSGHKAMRAYIRFLRNQLPAIREPMEGGGHVHEEFEAGKEETSCLSLERQDAVFAISQEEAAALPEELELPDGLSREEMEAVLQQEIERRSDCRR